MRSDRAAGVEPPVVVPRSGLVIGVDPSLTRTGWAVVDPVPLDGRYGLVRVGSIRTSPAAALPDRLACLVAGVVGAAEDACRAVVEESVVGGHRGLRSALLLAQARGAIVAGLTMAGLSVAGISPTTVKRVVAGHGHAPKGDVAAAVRGLIGFRAGRVRGRSSAEGGLPANRDQWDAVAVALTAILGESGAIGADGRSGAGKKRP
ncbi:crossover junction endodeoxyribonuclease RuvC [Candidatus Poriferisocius sp.]|uniref:crossover junction endodeoxyribonuclease RuvC n=1 Tax=Candidatus Poriferisocius sp. TaxID=3101276 RepID=UPI003B018FC5